MLPQSKLWAIGKSLICSLYSSLGPKELEYSQFLAARFTVSVKFGMVASVDSGNLRCIDFALGLAILAVEANHFGALERILGLSIRNDLVRLIFEPEIGPLLIS